MIRLQIEEEKLLLCEHAYVCGWVHARACSVFLFPLNVIVGVLLIYPKTPESVIVLDRDSSYRLVLDRFLHSGPSCFLFHPYLLGTLT